MGVGEQFYNRNDDTFATDDNLRDLFDITRSWMYRHAVSNLAPEGASDDQLRKVQPDIFGFAAYNPGESSPWETPAILADGPVTFRASLPMAQTETLLTPKMLKFFSATTALRVAYFSEYRECAGPGAVIDEEDSCFAASCVFRVGSGNFQRRRRHSSRRWETYTLDELDVVEGKYRGFQTSNYADEAATDMRTEECAALTSLMLGWAALKRRRRRNL
jgi:hypothetical protein